MKHSGYDVAATLIHRRHQRLQHAVAAGPRESIGEVVSSALKASKPDAYDFDNEQALSIGGLLGAAEGAQRGGHRALQAQRRDVPEERQPLRQPRRGVPRRGQQGAGLANYQRSLELDPKNQGAKESIACLQKPVSAVALKYPLEAFTGSYALAPSFTLKVFLEEGALEAQGTHAGRRRWCCTRAAGRCRRSAPSKDTLTCNASNSSICGHDSSPPESSPNRETRAHDFPLRARRLWRRRWPGEAGWRLFPGPDGLRR